MVRQKSGGGLRAFFSTETTAIWPHELFAALYQHHREAFNKYVLGGGPGEIKKFWEKMPPRPGMGTKRRWNEICIPLALHGDGVAVSNIRGKSSKSIDAISWTSLLATGPSKFTVFLVWFCVAHMAKRSGFAQTWPAFWARMCRSLRALWAGKWPSETVEGQPEPRAGLPLAGGYCAVLYSNRGDLEWMTKAFHLRNVTSSRPCSLCKCTNFGGGRDRMPWTDCNEPASWLDSCVDDQAHMPWGTKSLKNRVP